MYTCVHCKIQLDTDVGFHEATCECNPSAAVIDISPGECVYVRKFETSASTINMRFRNLSCVNDLLGFMAAGIQRVIETGIKSEDENAVVGIEITHPNLSESILVPFTNVNDLDVDMVLSLVESVVQSNEDFTLDETIHWRFVNVQLPSGRGKYKRRVDLESWLASKTCNNGTIIKIPDQDGLCLPRAIVTGIARIHRNDGDVGKKLWSQVRKGDSQRRTKQKTLAEKLVEDAGLFEHWQKNGNWGTAEMVMLDKCIGEKYQLRVFSTSNLLSCIYPASEDGPAQNYINVLLHEKHYSLITSVAALFDDSYFCDICRVSYHNPKRHTSCGQKCKCCYHSPVCKPGKWRFCSECCRWFRNNICYDNHKREIETTSVVNKKRRIVRTSVCTTIRRCPNKQCKKLLTERVDHQKHKCGEVMCPLCKQSADKNHKCFMQRLVVKKQKTSFIFFDFEACQNKEWSEGKFLHEINVCCVEKCCDECLTEPEDQACARCVDRTKIFMGQNSLNDFAKWLFSRVNKKCIAFAHNFQGYDGQFLLSWLEKNAHKPKLILRGNKIIKLECNMVTILDSLNYFPFPLSQLPKAFGIDEVKGYFPHLFNNPVNFDYVGSYPTPEFYGVDDMIDAAPFYEWYNSVKDQQFNFKEQIISYCKQDVSLLKQGCMKFRELMMSEFSMDPYLNSTTIASACMAVFRSLFLPENAIAIVPNGGYRKQDRHSAVALKWLQYISVTENLNIQHARNGGEVRIGNFKVDGQDRNNKSQLFEFYGDAFHGCKRCYPQRHIKLPLSDITAKRAYEDTMTREMELSRMGYKLRTLWECELHELLRKNQGMRKFFTESNIDMPLDPREALYGGRTCSMRMLCTPKADEYIGYVDVCSLYPYICKYSKFPVSHPVLYTENFKEISSSKQPYFGIIKCTVLPPRRLFHPVLGWRWNGKLIFNLCTRCTREESNKECMHCDDDRMMTGAWCTPELYKALESGYKIIRVIEVYHFEQSSMYDGNDPKTGLFTQYINAFLKLKQQASGWPNWVKTEEERQNYIDQYSETEGIELEKEKISHNPGLRTLAKLGLNSFWGKFGQRTNLTKTAYVKTRSELTTYITNPQFEVQSLKVINSDLVAVQYKKGSDYVEDIPNSNTIIAAFVTTYARLKLLHYLERLGQNALYCDTDSVIFLAKPGSYVPPTGDFLGEMKDELDGTTIVDFVSTGPKCYAYLTSDGKSKIIMKGFRVGRGNCRPSFDTMKKQITDLVENGVDPGTYYTANQIIRDKDHNVFTAKTTKKFMAANTKCRILPDYTTLPYGF